ncbi:MAG: TetR family transcriptional regulator [Pseudonocardiaceae bacterium]|nr:TetR family transcriptional regulator [Pseudonocardiaceae bacterium]
MTTRAIAERASVPHGSVSYHFRGKQELLTEAALYTVEHMFPLGELEAVETLADLMPLITTWLGTLDSTDPALTGVLMEAMRESERDNPLRHRLATMLRDYRRLLADLVHAEQHRDVVPSGATPAALATLIAAAGDGLLLHALLDPELDVAEAVTAMGTLLGRPPTT